MNDIVISVAGTDGSLPWPEFDAETRQVFRLDTATAAYEPPMAAAAFVPGVAA